MRGLSPGSVESMRLERLTSPRSFLAVLWNRAYNVVRDSLGSEQGADMREDDARRRDDRADDDVNCRSTLAPAPIGLLNVRTTFNASV